MKKIKKFKKLKNKIKGLSIELDKHTTKLSDLDELDGVIEDFKKETDDRYTVDVSIDLSQRISRSNQSKKTLSKAS
jgi:hypothetical protein